MLPGHVYHLTARCHDRSFLFKFGLDRDEYRRRLRELLRDSKVSVLTYCITSNHVHLVISAPDPEAVAELMQELQGKLAEWYNGRARDSRKGRGRTSAFWEGRYHATMVETGRHLWNCMTYVDLNMIRAGVVKHPLEWKWCGYDELVGARSRYCVVDKPRVLEIVGGTTEDLAHEYAAAVTEAFERGRIEREPHWTEAIAVGSEAYVKDVGEQMNSRYRLTVGKTPDGSHMVSDAELHPDQRQDQHRLPRRSDLWLRTAAFLQGPQ